MNFIKKDIYENDVISAKPFLKWAGGKTQLLNQIESNFPDEIKHSKVVKKFCEPFIGGGAVYFYLMSNYNVKESYIFDINCELILVYQTIKNDCKKLIESLHEIRDDFFKSKDRKEFYLNIRREFNEEIPFFDYDHYSSSDYINRSAKTIFMNKTCFNGLFRLNKKGEFNVPYGKYKNPKIFDEETLFDCSYALKNTNIICGSFIESKRIIDDDTLVYLDPPYRPISKSSNFTNYFKSDFNDENQIELADYFHEITKIGAKAILSNSYSDDGFFDELYGDYNMNFVKAKRSINRDGKKRGCIKEILVKNF